MPNRTLRLLSAATCLCCACGDGTRIDANDLTGGAGMAAASVPVIADGAPPAVSGQDGDTSMLSMSADPPAVNTPQMGADTGMMLGSGAVDMNAEAAMSNDGTDSGDMGAGAGVSTSTEGPRSTLERPLDPVVLSGESLGPLVGAHPAALVAFRYSGAWTQIPIQVDERAEVDFYDIYNRQYTRAGSLVKLEYVDPGTLTGPDPDATIDMDDEVVFMARDAGSKAESFSDPPGVVPGSGVEAHVIEPADATQEGYIYLFESDGSLTPDGGMQYGTYDFQLTAGTYPDDYSFRAGPNPEDTTFSSPNYERHFSDRWLNDVIKIFADGASGVDILDVQENKLPDGCLRHVGSYNAGEGAFVTNKAGAVRSIRSYIGANSGPLTQKTHIFYESREDITAVLRVHALPWSPIDTLDYSKDGIGLTYYNANNTGGALIDGQPDELVAASNESPLSWEMVTGDQGTLVAVHQSETDISGLVFSSYYLDQADTNVQQCNGDVDNAYGQSGVQVNGALPNTDPSAGSASNLAATRYHYYFGPSAEVADAEALDYQARNPLTAELSPVVP